MGYQPRLADPVTPNEHKAINERTDRNTVPTLRVWRAWGFHSARPERRRRSLDVACGLALGRAVDGLARAEVPKPPRFHRDGFTVFV